MIYCNQLIQTCENHLSNFQGFCESTVKLLIACNWLGWKYWHHEIWQTLQIRACPHPAREPDETCFSTPPKSCTHYSTPYHVFCLPSHPTYNPPLDITEDITSKYSVPHSPQLPDFSEFESVSWFHLPFLPQYSYLLGPMYSELFLDSFNSLLSSLLPLNVTVSHESEFSLLHSFFLGQFIYFLVYVTAQRKQLPYPPLFPRLTDQFHVSISIACW